MIIQNMVNGNYFRGTSGQSVLAIDGGGVAQSDTQIVPTEPNSEMGPTNSPDVGLTRCEEPAPTKKRASSQSVEFSEQLSFVLFVAASAFQFEDVAFESVERDTEGRISTVAFTGASDLPAIGP